MTEDPALLYALFLILPFSVFFAGAHDLLTYEIPNVVSILLIIAFLPYALLNQSLTGYDIAAHYAVGFGVLLFSFILFACRIFGGGDAKILSAIAVWLGPYDIVSYIVIVAIIGGALAVALIAMRASICAYLFYRTPVLKNIFFGAAKNINATPYAVAIAAGVFFFLPQSRIYELTFSVS